MTQPTENRALRNELGWADFSTRTQLEMRGADRAKFLHNLCTNNIKELAVGSGCEAFLLTAQGKILGHVLIFATPDALVLETEPGQGARLLQHFDRYLIREQVELHDRSQDWSELLLAGPEAEEWLARQTAQPPAERLAHCAALLLDQPAFVRRVDCYGPAAFLIAAARNTVEQITLKLHAEVGPPADLRAVEALRIEAGFPRFGIDITEKNLPQEVARDRAAISFTKGCYIGQETVARIDALGHVNRLLCGVRFERQANAIDPSAEAIPPGTELSSSEQPHGAQASGSHTVGAVTSAAYSPRLKAPLALAYLRRGQHEPGTKLTSIAGAAEVIALPLK
ncbi:MAG TPA: glycine cleavage T C-terminal barrel domain-containing protein [Pirellulales bacterium]|jgi:folate-binding protein YgfZ|nr:glycine cleavage T C-terminal barrel domain-containing protein [Pirellulales bacterium]